MDAVTAVLLTIAGGIIAAVGLMMVACEAWAWYHGLFPYNRRRSGR